MVLVKPVNDKAFEERLARGAWRIRLLCEMRMMGLNSTHAGRESSQTEL